MMFKTIVAASAAVVVSAGLVAGPAIAAQSKPTTKAAAAKKVKYIGYFPVKNWNKVSKTSGHDLGVKVGTPVYAMGNGVVIESRDLKGYEPRIKKQNGYRGYGRYITINYTSGPIKGKVLVAHLSKRFVTKGKKVKGGQRIGLSGMTGHVYGPAIHIESSKNYNGVALINRQRNVLRNP